MLQNVFIANHNFSSFETWTVDLVGIVGRFGNNFKTQS